MSTTPKISIVSANHRMDLGRAAHIPRPSESSRRRRAVSSSSVFALSLGSPKPVQHEVHTLGRERARDGQPDAARRSR